MKTSILCFTENQRLEPCKGEQLTPF